MSKAVVLAVELVGDAAVATSPCAGSSSQTRKKLSRTRVEAVSLTAKLDKLENKRDNTRRQRENIVRN